MKTFKRFLLEWSKTSVMNHARRAHTASTLSNGNVLVTGGFARHALNDCELYDPSTKTWTTVGSMNEERTQHTVSMLKDGKVLVTGGSYFGVFLNSAELY
ncbi:unnamed protein product [Rotaria sp. Silwood1]|nr:unnamed protein product [Rotaria sp. Silwood1]CAF4956620.1 unnamed protein product [Rotaria sp. Silwood1]